jgi:hypothetical protein
MGATEVAPKINFLSLRGVKESLRQAALGLDPVTRLLARALLKKSFPENTRRRLVADFYRSSHLPLGAAPSADSYRGR